MADTYTPNRALLLRYGIETCEYCGSLPHLHHSNGQCYMLDDIVSRLSYQQLHGRFPDEDCGP